ncbi:MAG: PBSX family phage terminase large subunit [Romboutsia timonensis]|uniref:PBSX family phage terminase large subunit n=1 Tax=Romboutsia timonensis TaxID=1776391 RepID=UPI001B6E3516|nr:PBSX family phage terminase large subunit [Peptostreptococcaceae bacterium]
MKLTPKQKAFADYYIELGNATEAAQKAGYKGNNLNRIASENLSKLDIKQYIEEKMEEISSNRIAKAEEVLQYLTRVIRDEETEQVVVTKSAGDFITEIEIVDKKLDAKDKIKASELLAKRYYLFNDREIRLKEMKMDLEIKKATEEDIKVDDKSFALPWNVISPAFVEALHKFEENIFTEYVFSGGRGSTKSSFISLKIIELIKNNPELNAVIVRQVANTLRDSVFAQIQWAIESLELTEEFKCTYSPLEITYKPTGQKIYFRGADEPTKLKGIKVKSGYLGILWFEELDQFKGPEAVRTIEQSVVRGGDKAYIFKSFNPPKTANNWANKYVKVPKKNRYFNHSNYTQVPKKWLGKAFIEEAEHLKEINPKSYEHEYLGIANGNGGNVFDNVIIREITDDEIDVFDRIYMGVDWGWFPDPWTWNKMYYNPSQNKLYIYDEARENKKSNKDTYEILVNEKGVTPADIITCDSAEKKSIQDYKNYGLSARGARKGPGSVDYSMKWLVSLNEIVIDNIRCPYTATEFLEYEYERTKDGEVISGYPDKENHHIDAVRYALEHIINNKSKGPININY